MKRVSLVMIGLVLIIFLAASTVSIRYLMDFLAIQQLKGGGNTLAPLFRGTVLLPDTREPFFLRLASALKITAKQNRVVLEFRPSADLEMAVLTKPDALLVYGMGADNEKKLINQAVDSRIPVITVASDVIGSKRQTFAGSNSFSRGVMVGNFIEGIAPRHSRIAVILSQNVAGTSQAETSSLLSGLSVVLKGKADHQVTEIRNSRPGSFSGEEIAFELFSRHPEINVVVCCSRLDTLAAAQTLVDQNRVGEVLIVGTDDSPEILDYLEKGIIRGTLVRNPEILGRLAIQSLIELKTTGNSSGFQDPGLEMITAGNVAAFRARSSNDTN